jgi:hypothetical protein
MYLNNDKYQQVKKELVVIFNKIKMKKENIEFFDKCLDLTIEEIKDQETFEKVIYYLNQITTKIKIENDLVYINDFLIIGSIGFDYLFSKIPNFAKAKQRAYIQTNKGIKY